MDFNDSAQEAEYRAVLRAWLTRYMDSRNGVQPAQREWHRALYDAGYIGQTWSLEEGGQGLPATYDAILNQEIARVRAPRVPANISYLGRSLFKFGTQAQKDRFLEPTLNGDIRWCQGFSEPGAGSDLAAMRTSAELVGDEWVINGQKLWTSGAQESDWCYLLARSEPDAPKHKGISVLLVDMRSPGVSVRTVRMTDGGDDTCETFFDNVRVPAGNLLGDRGQGWSIAMWALGFERGPVYIGVVPDLTRSLAELEAIVRERGLEQSIDVRRALTKAYVDIQVLDLNSLRQISCQAIGRPPGSDGPVAKLLWSVAAQSVGHAWLEALGPEAAVGADGGPALSEYLRSRWPSVFGGTAQVQRNQLSQRFMGMPRG